ncbi:MAG: hypothetical protein RIT43_83 [Bacteroidota bacterium]
MKKTLFSLCIATISLANAQTVTMEQANEPSVGNLKTMYLCDSLTDPLETVTGNNVTWDYSSIVGINSTRTIEVIDPATSPYSAQYPTSTKGFSIQGSLTNFYNSTATERVSQGFIFEEPSFGLVIATFGTDEQKTVSYPFAYGSTLTDNFAGSLQFDFNGMAQNPTCTGTSYASIDGQGTLLLPSGNTFSNVIRYKIVDTVFTQVSFIVPIDVIFVRTQYEYYDLTNDNLPLFTHSFVTISQASSSTPLATQSAVLSSVQPTITTSLTALTEENILIYPNPATEDITISSIGKNTTLFVSDLAGRTILSLETESFNQVIDISELPEGTYLLTSDRMSSPIKLIKK